jgi:PAS domain S-box-containing protein
MGALLLLCILFVLGRPDTSEHDRYRIELRDLWKVSFQLDQDILRVRMGLEPERNSWPGQFAALRERAEGLRDFPRVLLKEQRLALSGMMEDYLRRLETNQKELALLQGEAARAAERRSSFEQRAFTLAGQPLPPALRDRLKALTEAVLAGPSPGPSSPPQVEAALTALAEVPVTPELRAQCMELEVDARQLLVHKREADAALFSLLENPASGAASQFITRYLQLYDEAVGFASRANTLLFAVSLLLVVFVMVVLMRLGQTGRQLTTLNLELESRVVDRTSALSRANEELRDNAARKAAILEGSLDCIITLDEAGRILEFNPAAEETFRLSGATAVGRDFRRLALPATLADGPRAVVDRSLQTTAEPGRATRLELVAMRADGALFPAELTIFRVRGDGPIRFSIYLRDISEREEVERMKNEFVSTVSHELRTPLTSIRGSLGLMENGIVGELPPPALDMVRIARTNTERLIRLINDILDLEKIESGKLELKLQALEISELIDATFSGLRTVADGAQVTLRSSTEGAEQVRGDRDRLIQVLTNLVSNAIKFSPSKGVVEVSVTRDARGSVRFSVIDQGPGISAEQRGRLFGKFQQLDGSDTRSKGGTGLGLAISQSIVKEHGGNIDVLSGPGRGSIFTFTMPAANMDPATLPVVRDESRHNVLIVTADEPQLSLMRDLLKLEGYRVLQTGSLQEAWRMIEAGAPDVLVLDTQLQDGNGLELMQRLRNDPSTYQIPILMVSAHLPEAEGVGAPLPVDWLVKPFNETRFLHLLRFTLRPPGKARVLVVEDDAGLRHTLRTLLEGMGAQCYEAADGDSAVALARDTPPDLIILDVGLPRMDGFEMVDILRQGKSRTTPLIVFTGRELSQDDQRQLTLGTTCHLNKVQSSEEEMVRRVREFLNGLLVLQENKSKLG